ncbi:MAG: cysteine hydrolase [Thermoleophilia bacterium]|nr:cysteine hydrolase [Thermoleophilia bacterium]
MSDWILAGRAALLIVHMQNSVCKVPSPLEALGHWRAAEEDGIVPRIRALQEAFRAKGLPVIFVCTYTPLEFKAPIYGGFWPGAKESGANRMGTRDVEVIEELAPVEGEPVFYNWPFNILESTDLHEHLMDGGIETVVLAGVATGMSLGTAAFALAERFYNLIVPSDACTDARRDLHRVIIESMIPAIGLVTTTDDVIAHLVVAGASDRREGGTGADLSGVEPVNRDVTPDLGR